MQLYRIETAETKGAGPEKTVGSRDELLAYLPQQGEAVLLLQLPEDWNKAARALKIDTGAKSNFKAYRYLILSCPSEETTDWLPNRLAAAGWEIARLGDFVLRPVAAFRRGGLEYRLIEIDSGRVIIP